MLSLTTTVPADQHVQTLRVTHGEHAHRGTVLAVDDRPRNVELLQTILGNEGYEVIPATSGLQALNCVAAKVPHLILLDVMMPDLDGFEVCRRLKHDPRTAEIAVIFLSAADDKTSIVRGIEMGGVDYVTKPFTKEELIARVNTHVTLQQLRERNRRLLQSRFRLIAEEMEDLKRPLRAIARKLGDLSNVLATSPDQAKQLLQDAVMLTDDALCHVSRDLPGPDTDLAQQQSLEYPVKFAQLQDLIGQWYLSAKRRSLNFKMHRAMYDVSLACHLSPLKYLVDLMMSFALNDSKAGDTIQIQMPLTNEALSVWIEYASNSENRSASVDNGQDVQWLALSSQDLQLTRAAERIGSSLRMGTRPNGSQVILLTLPLHNIDASVEPVILSH